MSKTTESGYYYEINANSDGEKCIRYLTNIGLLRILGEKEQYNFYRNEGIFKYIANKFNNTAEIKENTNKTIDKVIANLGKLNIILNEDNTKKV